MNLMPVAILGIAFAFGVPVSYALVLCVIPYFFADPYIASTVIVQRMVSNTESTSMMAAPFFIIAGCIMNYSGATNRLLSLADSMVGHMIGGLGHVNILLSTLMGGISGSGAADAAMECKLLVPEMEKRGYGRAYSGAITAASACITPIIPPGVGLVIFAVVCEVSVGKLMCAGYIPGMLMCVGMMAVNTKIARKRGYMAAHEERVPRKEVWKVAKEASWALIIPFGLILGLRAGAFTATEGGAIISIYSLFIGRYIYKELEFKQLPKIFLEAVFAIGPVMLVLCAANVFSYYLSWERIPQAITELLISVAGNKYVFLLMVNVLMLVLGMFLDGMACMMIIAPLLAPVATALGVDLIHFGIVMVLNCAIGAITPPFGTYLFLVSGTIHVKTESLVKEIWPFIGVCIAVLLLITYVPSLVTIIPDLIYGNM
ncbi:TRAP transporter large permease [Chakrabartyella piscis]|uniref:TRAP transporter large permease n=1 Tax=Chakrabartyella piscis TaxID=2918914 RepID=UPI002958DACC|nr:TRAP transporter large permease [Chakrabartyella piscis]